MIAADVVALEKQGVTPGLAVVLVGDDPASRVYVTMKEKACEKVLNCEHDEASVSAEIDTSPVAYEIR